MASRIKDAVDKDNVRRASPERPPTTDYERDFYGWLLAQARHVRDSHWDAVDRENLAEEIESLGREQFNKLEGALRVLMLHMLKWDRQPERRSRSWALSIKSQRLEVEDVLSDNPSLKPRIAEAIARGYRKARVEAARETGLDEDVFLVTCPYDWNEIIGREFSI
jgi:hypothetical protein